MLLPCSDNRLFAGTWSDWPARVPVLNGTFAAVLMFLYRNGAM